MGILVMKFGGSSMGSSKKIKQMAEIILRRGEKYQHVVVVVSAMGKTTERLLKLAKHINESPSKREQDMLISVGERISMSLLAMALHKIGKDSVSFTGSQSGIITNSDHCDAKIINIKPERIFQALNENKIVIVAGFQGVSEKKEITTLGRGGSDTSAVALAIAVNAEKVEFYKDVAGVYEEDPKKNRAAKKFDIMSYDNALHIINQGSKILHGRCVKLAAKNNILLHVLSYKRFSNDKIELNGTFIGDKNNDRKGSKFLYEIN